MIYVICVFRGRQTPSPNVICLIEVMLSDGSRMICVASHLFRALDLFCTDPAHYMIVTDTWYRI